MKKHIKVVLFLVVGFSAVLMGIGAWMYFVPASHPNQVGEFTTEEFPNQTQIVNAYFEKDRLCAHEFLGRDQAHIFIEIMCGNFRIVNDQVEVTNSFRLFSRLDYNNSTFEVTGHKNPEAGSFYHSSLVRLFPEIAYKKIRFGEQGDPRRDFFISQIREKLKNAPTP